MVVLLRYACLLGIGLGAILSFFGAVMATGQLLVEDQAIATSGDRDVGIWIMAALTVLGLMSLAKFTFGGIPGLFRGWYQGHRDRLMSLLLIIVMGTFFLIA